MAVPQHNPAPARPEETPTLLSEISPADRLSQVFRDVVMCMIKTSAPEDRDLRIKGAILAVKFETLAAELERLGAGQFSFEMLPTQPIQMIGLLQVEFAKQVARLDPELESVTRIANRSFLVDSVDQRLMKERRPLPALREYSELGRLLLLIENNLNEIRVRLAA